MPKGIAQNFVIVLDRRTIKKIKELANVEGIDPERLIENFIHKFKEKYSIYVDGGSDKNIPPFFRDILPPSTSSDSSKQQPKETIWENKSVMKDKNNKLFWRGNANG